MYTMKNISKYLGAALLLFCAACSKTQEGTYYTPNKDDSKQIHFIQSSIEKEFAQDAESGIINVEIARTGSKGTYKVFLAQKGNDSALFSIPSEATFEDGEHSVTVPVQVDLSNFVMGSSYKTTLMISGREANPGDDGAQVSQFTDKVTLSASYELTWEPYMRIDGSGEEIQQLATYHYSLYYTGRDSGLEVEKAVGANIFRLKDWASGVTFKFIVHDDNTCTVPAQSIGYFNSNYNEYVFVADMAVYTGSDSAYASYPCTFDGKDTFSFYLIYYVSGGYFAQGKETLVFDSEADTTPTVDIEYLGIEATPTGFKSAKLRFSPNSYARSYKATVVEGDISGDKKLQEQVRQQLIDDTYEGPVPVMTLNGEDESVWNVPRGSYTAVALAYDSVSNPCGLYSKRFTCDPDNDFAVRVNDFKFYPPTDLPGYSPYNTLVWEMQTANVVKIKYLCVKSGVADYLCEALGMSLEELTVSRGYDIDPEIIAAINSEEGRATTFSPLDQGSGYVLALQMTNAYGDTSFVSKTASTYGYFASDFDQTKNMEDFLGAFSASATITAGSNDITGNFRIDITRVNDRDVIIRGMSDMRDFAPQISGYYDAEKHMIIIEPQSAGMYGQNYAVLGFSDGISIYWGGNSMAIGYIGDKLYWASSPYAEKPVESYMFLLFSSPQTTGANYLREYVGSRSYSAISMVPLKLAPAAASQAAPVKARTQAIEAAGRSFPSYLPNDTALPAAKASARAAQAPAAAVQAAGKTLRTDLTLHTR